MNQPHTNRLSSWARLVGLALLLGVGLLASLGLASRTAHAQPAATSIVSTCDDATLRNAINNAASGDTITFGCSGTITLGSTLVISKNLTLDGSGQNVTLSGGGSVQVLSVNSGVSFTLNDLTVAHGLTSGDGGGLFNNGTVSISNSTFANNEGRFGGTARGGGGGLYNNGTMSISNSTFANNSASGGNAGGGLENFGTVSISNSTFANNSAFAGGGLITFGGTVSISNSTFANNSAPDGFGGGLNNQVGTVSITQSIVANNSAGRGGSNCFNLGTITDQGYNLESGTDCGFTGTGDLQNTDPKLASTLASNGGPTQTLALLDGSPAIDHIPAANCPATDQRGVTRPDDGETTCDIGAYEFQDPPDNDLALTNIPSTITVNATSPQGAVVTYTQPTVVDEDSPLPPVSCTPASGSTFAIGTTTVTCTVSDSDDTPSSVSQSFTVTVNGAVTQVNNLITTVNSFGLPADIQAGFDTQLQAVQTDLTNTNPAQACSDLMAFINHVQAQSGKHLTVSQANQLLAAAKQIRAVLGC